MGQRDEGEALPATVHRWPSRTDGPWVLELQWRILDGRPECVGLRLASTGVFPDLPSDGEGEFCTTLRARNGSFHPGWRFFPFLASSPPP